MILNKKELTLGHTYYYGEFSIKTAKILTSTDILTFDVFPERYSGVPLSSDMLVKGLRFERVDNSYYPSDDKFPFCIESRGDKWYLCTDFYGGETWSKEIYSVHEVQDIHYATTREDLEFKTVEG